VFERTGERKAEGERWNVWKLHAIATVKCETESTFLLMVDPPLFSLPNTTTTVVASAFAQDFHQVTHKQPLQINNNKNILYIALSTSI
tara:strand:- start:38 stop:301 length:264 start_codon:yes stop_codon:yes gene_type:complete